MEEDISHLQFVDEREKRNVEAWGEDGKKKQEVLYNSRIMVVGSDVLSQMVLTNLLGLGIRNLCCVDDKTVELGDKYNFLYSKRNGNGEFLGEKRVKHIANTLETINIFVTAQYYESPFTSKCGKEFIPEVIVDATNDPKSKSSCLDYCVHKGIPFVSVVSNQKSAILTAWNPNGDKQINRLERIINSEFLSQQQGSYTSGVIASLAAEQIRKLKFHLGNAYLDEPLGTGQNIVYNPHPFPFKNTSFENLRVLVVGAGAIGNFVALNLALLGIGNIDILDGDIIEDHNLNRQFLLHGRVGDFKAEVLSERIKGINSSVNGKSYGFYLTEEKSLVDRLDIKRYDMIFGCVDNYRARYFVNSLATRHRIPYIDGGTSATSGRVAVYLPGKNRCIDCQFNLKGYMEKEKPKRFESSGQGCANNPNPSIVIPNMIIGSEMVAEFINFISGTPQLLDKVFKYDHHSSNRIYLQPLLAIRRCEFGCA